MLLSASEIIVPEGSFSEIYQMFIIPIIVGIVILALAACLRYIKNKIYDDKLIVKEITIKTDNDVEGFIELYNRKIDSDLRICAEQIIEFIDTDSADGLDHHLCICKHRKCIVGFVKCIVVRADAYIFIAYIAVDQQDSVAVVSGVDAMMKFILKKYVKCTNVMHVITEIERGSNNSYITSLAKTIGRRAKKYEYSAYVLCFDYIQPRMPDDRYAQINENILSLIWIPLYQVDKMFIPRKKVVKLIKSIYNNIYYPSCNCLVCDCDSYKKYLNSVIATYITTLQNRVAITKIM